MCDAVRLGLGRHIGKRGERGIGLLAFNGKIAAALQMPAVNQHIAGDQQRRAALAPFFIQFDEPVIAMIVAAARPSVIAALAMRFFSTAPQGSATCSASLFTFTESPQPSACIGLRSCRSPVVNER